MVCYGPHQWYWYSMPAWVKAENSLPGRLNQGVT
jgi:hypothetical protein